jgi:exosome complex component RRP42
VAISENQSQLAGAPPPSKTSNVQESEKENGADGLWKAPLGGTRFSVLERMIQAVLEKGGIADEVLDGLDGVELES